MSETPRRTLAFFLIPVLGALLVAFGTHRGAGLSRDSLRYVRGAENIALGNGYADIGESGTLERITHWPPLYSIALAVPIATRLSTQVAVRIVNALSFFATLCLVGVLVRRLAPHSRFAAIAAMLAVMLSPAIVHNHLMAWSETIFVPLILVGCVKLLDYAARGRMTDVMIAGLAFGLATVTRYAGVALVLGAAVALVVWNWRERRARALARVVSFGAAAGVPVAIWLARNYFSTQSAHDRPFEPQGLGLHQFRAAVDATSAWLLPSWFNLPVRALWLLIVVGLAVLAWRRVAKPRPAPAAPLPAFTVLVVACASAYVGFVAVTMMLFDHDVNFDVRMMTPVYVLLVIAFAAVSAALFARPRSLAAKALGCALSLSFVALASASVVHAFQSNRKPPQFASPQWTNAGAWEVVKAYPADTPLYSTQPEVSQYFTRRGVRELSTLGNAAVREVLVLHYPLLDDAAESKQYIDQLNARTVDSTDAVVMYSVKF